MFGINVYLGGKDLTCLNNGKCKDHQCQCKEHFMGHDCGIGMLKLEMGKIVPLMSSWNLSD